MSWNFGIWNSALLPPAKRSLDFGLDSGRALRVASGRNPKSKFQNPK
jgi:hypothetical protein